jgi:hypothetical protein
MEPKSKTKRLPFRELRKVADAVAGAVVKLETRRLRRLLREVSQGDQVDSDLAPAVRRIARFELLRRDKRRRQLPLL